MHNHTTRTTRRAWAPRALAVLSFALAMLAAHPGVVAADSLSDKPAVVLTGESPDLQPDLAQTPVAPRHRTPRQAVSARSEMRLHILASMEILRRLVAAELAGVPVSNHAVLSISFEPICLGSLAPATVDAAKADPFTPPPPVPAERTFAIARLLLAPPIA